MVVRKVHSICKLEHHFILSPNAFEARFKVFNVGAHIQQHRLQKLMRSFFFNPMFPLIFHKKAKGYGKKEHEKLQEVFPPFFFLCYLMWMFMYFHIFRFSFCRVIEKFSVHFICHSLCQIGWGEINCVMLQCRVAILKIKNISFI